MLVIVALISLLSFFASQVESQGSVSATGFRSQWWIHNSSYILFKIECDCAGYVGIGFTPGNVIGHVAMDSYTSYWMSSGTTMILDGWSDKETRPANDTNTWDGILVNSTRINTAAKNLTTTYFLRKMDTGDANDTAFTVGTAYSVYYTWDTRTLYWMMNRINLGNGTIINYPFLIWYQHTAVNRGTFYPTTIIQAPTPAPTTSAPTTAAPTFAPTTAAPTFVGQTLSPTNAPTTKGPTPVPTTLAPTQQPTQAPTHQPTYAEVETRGPESKTDQYSSSGGAFNMGWKIVGDSIQFTMSAKVGGWVGLSLSSTRSHVNSDQIGGSYNPNTGAAVLLDCSSNSEDISPPVDAQNDLTLLNASQVNGWTTISFSRKLVTNDTNDYSITDAFITVGWAYHPTYMVDYGAYQDWISHSPTERGEVKINFITGKVTTTPASASNTYLYLIVVIAAVHVVAHWGWILVKCLLPKRVNGMNASTPVSVGAVSSSYYRGSSAVPYGASGEEPPVVSTSDGGGMSESPKMQRFEVSKGGLKAKNPSKISAVNWTVGAAHKRLHIWGFHDLTLIDILYAVLFVALNIVFVYYWNVQYLELPGKTLGYLASANALFIALPATRNSFFVWLLGIPFEKALLYHRFLGQFLFLEQLVHWFFYIGQTLDNWKNKYGLCGLACLCFVYFSSLPIVRRKKFDLFYYSHFAFVGYYVLGSYHSPTDFYNFAWAALAFYLLDRLVRLFWGIYPQKVSLLSISEDASHIRIRFRKHPLARYSVGQYVFINFPEISVLDWHPFTLSNGPSESELEVNIKSLGSHTKNLIAKAKLKDGLWIRVDGPYGKWPFNLRRYSSVVLLAGGVGITPVLSFLREVYQYGRSASGNTEPVLKDIYLVWVMRSASEYAWFSECMEEILARGGGEGGAYPALHAHLHVTQDQSGLASDRLQSGRPDLSSIFDGVQQKANDYGRVAVVTCGPNSLVQETWDEASSRTKKHLRFDFHHETFEF
jgi:predicted ferric reductase